MKFAIIGAGFYGLHIASRLRALGLEATIYEQQDQILSFASGNNQYRLHLGFHYARNFRTRQQSRDGYFRFMERYGRLTREIEKNYYSKLPELDLVNLKNDLKHALIFLLIPLTPKKLNIDLFDWVMHTLNLQMMSQPYGN